MSLFNVYKSLDLVGVCDEILDRWREDNTFERSIEHCSAVCAPFYEGPPSANGLPGIHHVLSRTIKDVFCRYKSLKGYKVLRKSGWDTHGLPVELQVEKSLGITKNDIGKLISVEDYNKKCRESVTTYRAHWRELTEKIGYWVDMDNPYITCDSKYMESEWWAFKELYKKGLIYQGFSIQPYSPAAGTVLSSHELNQPGCYKSVKDTTITVQFKTSDDDAYYLAWTTTPWTLPANSALAVRNDIEYVKVRTTNQYTGSVVNVILAKDALDRYFSGSSEYELLTSYKGSDLVGRKYEQLLPFVQPHVSCDLPECTKAFEIIPADYVTTSDGTGIVHIAPTFGADDLRVAKKAGIMPITVKRSGYEVPIVDEEGKIVDEVTPWAGRYVKEAYESDSIKNADGYVPLDVAICVYLKKDNKAFKIEKHEHMYPHCWRTDKPLLYYPAKCFFIKTTVVKDRMVELNKDIKWHPESTGQGRFANWLENIVDWNVSRNRFWGTPIPIWQTDDHSEEKCIGSVDELRHEIEKSVVAGTMSNDYDISDIHKPFIDDIVLVSDSGEPMHRVPEVLDVWFDSGAMPFAQWHYPFENKDVFEEQFPAEFIAEGVDQTRGWFFTLHALSTMLFDSVAYKNVVSNGLVLDKNGNKMSKRLGNTVNPFELIGKYGADVIRWYMITNAYPWENLKFDIEGVEHVYRKFFLTLFNTYNFFAMYANLDHISIDMIRSVNYGSIHNDIDRWIVSKLNTLICDVDGYLCAYNPTKAARAIQNFVVDDLSNWYVRLNRKRFWKSESDDDKIIAYSILFKCLEKVSIVSSPFIPFYSEKMYTDLYQNSASVHLQTYPAYKRECIDSGLESSMDVVKGIVSTIHALRKENKIKVRQPLARLMIYSGDSISNVMTFKDLILHETNIKSIEVVEDTLSILEYRAKPNFKVLGSRCGTMIKFVASEINALTNKQISSIMSGATVKLSCGVDISKDDLILSEVHKDGVCVGSFNGITIALDTHITDELKRECIARDFVNLMQNYRKDSGFNVSDHVMVSLFVDCEFTRRALLRFKHYICKELLCDKLELTDTRLDSMSDIEQFSVRVERIKL